MPELPEVETIVRDLRLKIAGRRVARVEIVWPRVVDPRGQPGESITGARIEDVTRRGKFIVAHFGGGRRAALHLRMTGRLIVDPPAPLPHITFVWHFEDGGKLVFADTRKFGRLRILADGWERELGIGVDPFDPRLDDRELGLLMVRRTTPVKAWLLDQRFVAGIGNIYACEALYYARIRPSRRVGRLTRSERRKLLASLRKVLTRAIGHRGSSVDDYVDAEGLPGSFQKQLAVYGRGGLPCRRCKTPIRRIVMAQRSTFFCPSCQR